MKEKAADIEGHRIKVGLDQQKPLSTCSSAKVGASTTSTTSTITNSDHKEGPSKNTLFASSSSNSSNNGSGSNPNNNFDDDYNEWDISIGDLIIDLDADIERQSEGDKSSTECPNKSSKVLSGANKTIPPNSKQFADISDTVSVMSSNLKSNRLSSLTSTGVSASANTSLSGSHNSSLVVATTPSVSSTNGTSSGTSHLLHPNNNQRNSYSLATNNTSTGNSSTTCNSTTKSLSLVEHHATVDKGLKMKIKRKNIGGKISETKHEIVSSDISPQACKPYIGPYDQNSNPIPNVASNNVSSNSIQGPISLSSSNSVITADTEGVQSSFEDVSLLTTAKSSKHSTKNKSAHRDKKERDKLKFEKEKLTLTSSSVPNIKGKSTSEELNSGMYFICLSLCYYYYVAVFVFLLILSFCYCFILFSCPYFNKSNGHS